MSDSTELSKIDDSTGHVPATDSWEFDEDVTRCFEDMLRRSIPHFDSMRDVVFRVGSDFVTPKTEIVDLGASRGDGVLPFLDRFGAQNRYVLAEVAPAMLRVLHERFDSWSPIVRIWDEDLTRGYPPASASLTLAVLTLQFIPVNYRHSILSKVYKSTVPGGAVVLVEKVLGSDAVTDERLVDVYHRLKVENGYPPEHVEAKRRALEGVLVPLTADWNEATLRSAGFSHVEPVWRALNFGAWLAVR